jgi:hypothetical protein
MRYDTVRTVSRRARPWLAAIAVAPIVVTLDVTGALAQTAPAAPTVVTPAPATQAAPAAAAPAAPAAPVAWVDGIKFNAQFEGGVVFNTGSPENNANFGQEFTDLPNNVQLNQALFTMQRTPDPKVDYDIGFAFQGLYGTDGRYLHFVGVLDQATNMRYQPAIIQANVQLHTPWLFGGGIDFKVGMYPTPLGDEVIDPSGNPFYSHSYIFNFGLPLLHTGALAIAHVTDYLDIYGGVDSGVNTSLGPYAGDNNSSYAGLGGFQLTLFGGNLTILALTHIGPENPGLTVPLANRYYRYFGDTVVTWKTTDKLTLTTELNYVHDDNPAIHTPTAYGIAQYASYALTDQFTLNGRVEFFNDQNGFFVVQNPGNQDFATAQAGYSTPLTSYSTGRGTDYGEITLGVTYKPTGLPAPIAGLLIRPEIRYDSTLDGVKAFNGPSITGAGKDVGVFTVATDVVLQF